MLGLARLRWVQLELAQLSLGLVFFFTNYRR